MKLSVPATEPTWLDLADWRQRVQRLYADRNVAEHAGAEPALVLQQFRAARDELFRAHPQSPLDAAARQEFTGVLYYPFAPELRVIAELTPLPDVESDYDAVAPAATRFRRAAEARFTLAGAAQRLILYWIDVYGGGLFLPFRDGTNGAETYGGGRYLVDMAKGSDFVRLDEATTLGFNGGRVLLDFNYAYNPSCAYDARWLCPLAPSENRLATFVRAGEQLYHP